MNLSDFDYQRLIADPRCADQWSNDDRLIHLLEVAYNKGVRDGYRHKGHECCINNDNNRGYQS